MGLTFLSFSLILSDSWLSFNNPVFVYLFDEVYWFLKAFKLFGCLGSLRFSFGRFASLSLVAPFSALLSYQGHNALSSVS